MRPPAAETPQPRSNADFRALLATPRAERGSYRSSFAGSGGSGGGGEQKEQKKDKPKKAPKPRPTAEEDAAKEDDGSGYRSVFLKHDQLDNIAVCSMRGAHSECGMSC